MIHSRALWDWVPPVESNLRYIDYTIPCKLQLVLSSSSLT